PLAGPVTTSGRLPARHGVQYDDDAAVDQPASAHRDGDRARRRDAADTAAYDGSDDSDDDDRRHPSAHDPERDDNHHRDGADGHDHYHDDRPSPDHCAVPSVGG